MPGARRQLKEVADALGIDRKEFEKMALETSKLEDKMSKIKFSGLDISKEDQEQLANLAQLQDVGGGRKEYVVNYRDADNKMQQAELSSLNRQQLDAIKKQTEQDAMDEGKDPQQELVRLAKEQLGQFGRLAAANEKIANTANITAGGSKGGDDLLKEAADTSLKFANNIVLNNFGPKSNFKTKLDNAGDDLGKISNLFINLVTGDFVKVFKSLESATSLFGGAIADVGTDLVSAYKTALENQLANFTSLTATVSSGTFNITAIEALKARVDAEKLKSDDGFYTPVGDTIKTPSGNIEIHEKDYFLAATQLPDVLQKMM